MIRERGIASSILCGFFRQQLSMIPRVLHMFDERLGPCSIRIGPRFNEIATESDGMSAFMNYDSGAEQVSRGISEKRIEKEDVMSFLRKVKPSDIRTTISRRQWISLGVSAIPIVRKELSGSARIISISR
jgi:hypothetical protein